MNLKPVKEKCEVCKESDKSVLDIHHIIPRTDPGCTNHDLNLIVLCSNCHRRAHANSLKIIGIYPSTSGRIAVYELDGIKNIDIDIPYFQPKPKEIKIK